MKFIKKAIIFLLILGLVLAVGCTKEEEQQPQTEQEIKIPEPTQETTEQTEQGEDGKILTLMRCTDDKIEAELYNNRESPVVVGDDMKIIFNGLIVPNPDCDNKTINPGEKVFCADITGKFRIKKDDTNKIQVNIFRERAIEYITCSS